jgi:uncharacterized protein with HEPN domain
VPRRSWDLRISDIIDAIENVLDYSAGMTFEQFAEDRKTIDAVVRNFMIIGEAATYLPKDFIEKHPDLPWREMRDMRNISLQSMRLSRHLSPMFCILEIMCMRKERLWNSIWRNLALLSFQVGISCRAHI